jgi:3-hydroxyisobutyrate dehydrogenase-like beta-hydroxyacid dehydrogenase
MAMGDLAPDFLLELALKDVDLALPLLEDQSQEWRGAVNAGHGRDDVSATYAVLAGSH